MAEEEQEAVYRLEDYEDLSLFPVNMREDFRIISNLIQKLQEENNNKDKQIDLMAKSWKQDDTRTVEEIKQYFEKQAKEV